MLRKLGKDFNTFEKVMKQAAVIPCDLKPVEGEPDKNHQAKSLRNSDISSSGSSLQDGVKCYS